MKKFLLVGITLLLTTLSCGEDRDDENTQQTTLSQKIVGNWTITKKETNGYESEIWMKSEISPLKSIEVAIRKASR